MSFVVPNSPSPFRSILDVPLLTPAELEAVAELGRVMFDTLKLPPDSHAPDGTTAPGLEGLEDWPSRACLPPLLTTEAHAAAVRLGIPLDPAVRICAGTDFLEFFGSHEHADAVTTIGMARLTHEFVRSMFASLQNPPPLILTLEEAAALGRTKPDTLKHQVSDGRIRTSVRRGRPLLFDRNLFYHEWMTRQ